MRKAGQRGRSSDQRAGVEGSGHASMNGIQIELRTGSKRGGARESISSETFE